jgi:retinaldehyde-binding protein 1
MRIFSVHVLSLIEKSTQINGVVVIMDFEGLSMKQIKGLSPASTKRLLTFIQDAMLTRLKEVHFVKQPFIFNMVWQMFKPFVKEKLKNRVRSHVND